MNDRQVQVKRHNEEKQRLTTSLLTVLVREDIERAERIVEKVKEEMKKKVDRQ